ncbi:MAG TPA: tetratricopeptide repeat protein, partial [Candidatus Atribacteria bacterium]|nr:tetratricopeptide repeat protein [Candidatus Atribacteria bacterium]
SVKEFPLLLAGPFLYFVVINNINDERQINRILNVVIVIGSLFGIYGILQYQGIDLSFWKGNVGRQAVFGLFGNVNYFAEYLIAILPLAVSLFLVTPFKSNKFRKLLLFIGILAMGGTLLLTFTRGSYLGLGVSLIFMFSLFLTCKGESFIKENKRIFIFILLIIILAGLLFTIPNPLSKEGTYISKIKARVSIASIQKEFTSGRRMAIWKFTSMMIKDRPLLGSGIGTFKYNSLRYQAEFFSQGDNRSLYPYGIAHEAHNEYLHFWAELGIIGLGIFLWMVIAYFYYGLKFLKKIKNNYSQGMLIGMMGIVMVVLVDGIFGFPLHLPATIVLFWLSLGLTISITLSQNGGEEKEREIAKETKNIKDDRNEKKRLIKFKPFLFIAIIVLSIFLCITLSRPFIARVYWFYGTKETKEKNLDKALTIYQKSLQYDPYLGEIYYCIGEILMSHKKDLTLAEEYFKKAEKYTDYPKLPQFLANVYYQKEEFEKAVTKLEQAITYQESKAAMLPLYRAIGTSYLKLKDYKKAEIAFVNALEIDVNSYKAHYGLAGAYFNQGKKDLALLEFKKVVELAPHTIEGKYSQKLINELE